MDMQPGAARRRKRMAVLALELIQGMCFAAWSSRIPDIREGFGVENLAHLGLLMALIPVGKLLAIPAVHSLFSLAGYRKAVLISILGYAFSLLLAGILPANLYILGFIFLLFGIFWNMTDISLNTQAIEVDRLYETSIMATFHAGWSFAACLGALLGFALINLNIGYPTHFTGIAVLSILGIGIAYRFLPLDHEHPVAVSVAGEVAQKKDEKKDGGKKRKLPEILLIQLGLIWLVALGVENTIFEWSDLYFQSVIKAPKSLQVGFLIIMTTIFTGRLITTLLYRYWKKRTILIVAGYLIFAGFMISSLLVKLTGDMTINVIINALGFGLIGLGISCVVPTLYSIVGEKAKTPVGTALTIMSSISFVGPFIPPLLVGTVSHYFGMDVAYLIIGLFGLCIVGITSFSKTLKRDEGISYYKR